MTSPEAQAEKWAKENLGEGFKVYEGTALWRGLVGALASYGAKLVAEAMQNLASAMKKAYPEAVDAINRKRVQEDDAYREFVAYLRHSTLDASDEREAAEAIGKEG